MGEFPGNKGVLQSHEVLGDLATDPPLELAKTWTINKTVTRSVCWSLKVASPLLHWRALDGQD